MISDCVPEWLGDVPLMYTIVQIAVAKNTKREIELRRDKGRKG